jgi:hypothetical protein
MRTRKTGSLVVGILAGDEQRQRTVGALRAAGFSGREIGSASDSGEVVVQDDALARADVAGRGLLAVLVGMGAPEQAAERLVREYAARRTVVTVQTSERVEEAAAILRQQAASLVRRWPARPT